MKAALIFIVVIFVCAIVTVRWMMIDNTYDKANGSVTRLPLEGPMPSLGNANAWLNSQPLTDADLRGKVVLINFWTYSCINWRRQLPYVRAWDEKYRNSGLVIVGIHTPEFTFEKDIANVRHAIKEMQIDYPVALDNGYSIWSDFANRYWPALYFVDSQGTIRHHQFGEGNYEKSERVIQQLLREAGAVEVDNQPAVVDSQGAEAAADWDQLGSPEIYAGYSRTANFASRAGVQPNIAHDYAYPDDLKLNHWALSGNWTIGREAAALSGDAGGVRLRFQARDLHLVMGPALNGKPVRFRVLIDGQSPAAAHGVDVDEQCNGTVVEPRMYQLIRQPMPITDRTFEIEFLDPGVEIYSFTFG